MRTLLLSIAAAGLFAGAAHAQFTSHAVVPGSDIIVAPAPRQVWNNPPASPPVAPPGLQSGIAGNADGSNDFPRARPDAGSLPPGWSAETGSRTGVSANVPDYPATWKGSAQDWTLHSQACKVKFPSYDAATDTFGGHVGPRAFCPASVGLKK